jgi:hypothetical protein
LQQWLSYEAERNCDAHYRELFRRTGLTVAGPNEVSALFEKASEHVSPAIYGEVISTVGEGLEAASEGYDGLIVIGQVVMPVLSAAGNFKISRRRKMMPS